MTGYTGNINTNQEFQSVATLTGITFSSGKTYNMQIQNSAYLKLGDAVFCFNNEKFDYKAGTDDLKIKTTYNSCILTIYEVEEE